jgi:hypothetical protein
MSEIDMNKLDLSATVALDDDEKDMNETTPEKMIDVPVEAGSDAFAVTVASEAQDSDDEKDEEDEQKDEQVAICDPDIASQIIQLKIVFSKKVDGETVETPIEIMRPVKDADGNNVEVDGQIVQALVKTVPLTKGQLFISELYREQINTDSKLLELTMTFDSNVKMPPADVANLIIKFIEHHNGIEQPNIPKPLKSTVMKEVTNEWDATFVDELGDLDTQWLYDVVHMANYLAIQSLLHLISAKLGSMIKGKTPEQIKEILKPIQEREEDARKRALGIPIDDEDDAKLESKEDE